MNRKLQAFNRLLDIMDDLREKCPWDRKQTMQSLSSLTVEETYELVDAIREGDMDEVKEEIGDLLLHMVFYAKIADETDDFDIADALDAVCEKLVRRHPHIYGETKVHDAEEVKQNWERIKMKEGKKSIFQGVPNALPPLIKAQRMQEKAAQVGFEWEEKQAVWAKVLEELEEFRQAAETGDNTNSTEEFGDVLFSLVNYARFLGIDSNAALDLTNAKFKKRVEYIEEKSQKPLNKMSLQEMDALWDEAKTYNVR